MGTDGKTPDAIEILHRRHSKGRPRRIAALQKERKRSAKIRQQYRYRRAKQGKGLCITCTETREPGNASYCKRHHELAKENNALYRKRYRKALRARSKRHYRTVIRPNLPRRHCRRCDKLLPRGTRKWLHTKCRALNERERNARYQTEHPEKHLARQKRYLKKLKALKGKV